MYKRKATTALVAAIFATAATPISNVFAAEKERAQNARVGLLELYTSEGCSSCPPADRWVSSLTRPELVPKKLVVLAFHVDYWDDLGWKDRFSQRLFTERQQDLVRVANLPTAYTPQLVFNGRDFRERGTLEAQALALNGQSATVHIMLTSAIRQRTLNIQALVEPTTPQQTQASLYIALYENNLETPVQAGENRGRRLHHDYVVRMLFNPSKVSSGKPLRWERDFPVPPDWKIADLGVAAFVQSEETGEVLQATAQMIHSP